MAKSNFVNALNQIQAGLRPLLAEHGFSRGGRTFNRPTPDRLTQVVNIQMAGADPPGSSSSLRRSDYGKFTINVGVYIPEVAKYHEDGEAEGKFVQEYHCSIRARLGELGPERRDLWWRITDDEDLIAELRRRLMRHAFPFLDKLATRDGILRTFKSSTSSNYVSTPRIMCAIILWRRKQKAKARQLLSAQYKGARKSHPGHATYVCDLSETLGLGRFDVE